MQVELRLDSGGRPPGQPQNRDYIPVVRGFHRNRPELAQGCWSSDQPNPGPISENQASIRLRSFGSGPIPPGNSRFSNAGTDHLFDVSGYRRLPSGRKVGPLTNDLFGGRPAAFGPPGSPTGEFQVPTLQVTVVSIGSPIEGAPFTGIVLPAPEKANRKSGLPGSGPQLSVPGQRDLLNLTGISVSREVLSLSQRGLAISGCNLESLGSLRCRSPRGP